MARILVVEDDGETAAEIAAVLERRGHAIDRAASGEDALDRLARDPFDAITLDRMLPGIDGLETVTRLRAARITTPVLMISALSDVDARIAGLRAGGDDYLVKPFSAEEMAVRIEVLLRRSSDPHDESILRAGALVIDLIRRKVWLDDEPVQLLHLEFRLLEFMARHQGQILGRRLIFEQVWGRFFDPSDNLINVHVSRLRRKLERPGRPAPIETIKGEGYRLVSV